MERAGARPYRGFMRFINLTRQNEIGANSYFLEINGRKIILDAGLHPKKFGEEAMPNYRRVADGEIDAVFISHAHQDHIGSLPILTRRQPQAKVFLTPATARLTEIMLHNSVNVMSRQREELALANYPLFTHREADQSRELWHELGVGQRWSLDGERLGSNGSEMSFEFFFAGHILGSTGILFRNGQQKVFYTGDVNFLDQTLHRRAEFPIEPLDVLIIETTRGDRALSPNYSRAGEEARFLQCVLDAFDRGGSVLIPVFALGKTQEILTLLHRFRSTGALEAPIYIGGLSTKITIVYDQLASSSQLSLEGLQLLETLSPFVLNGRDVATTQVQRNRLYVLSSGMMTEKTLSNQMASRFVDRPEQSVFFVGYADPDSPAGKLKTAEDGASLQMEQGGSRLPVLCTREEFDFSGHAPRELLLDYIVKTTPKKVVLIHGDPPSLDWFKGEIATALPECQVIVPEPDREYDL
jgi:Cft2 family RNA processing exonuclease